MATPLADVTVGALQGLIVDIVTSVYVYSNLSLNLEKLWRMSLSHEFDAVKFTVFGRKEELIR